MQSKWWKVIIYITIILVYVTLSYALYKWCRSKNKTPAKEQPSIDPPEDQVEEHLINDQDRRADDQQPVKNTE